LNLRSVLKLTKSHCKPAVTVTRKLLDIISVIRPLGRAAGMTWRDGEQMHASHSVNLTEGLCAM